MLKNLVSPDANVALILSDMHEALKRADLIIHGLLDFSVPRALDLHAEDLSAIIEQSLGLVRHELAAAPIQVVKDLQPDMPWGRAALSRSAPAPGSCWPGRWTGTPARAWPTAFGPGRWSR